MTRSASPFGLLDSIPYGRRSIEAAAAKLGLPIPEACMAGVIANLELLGRHAETLGSATGTPR